MKINHIALLGSIFFGVIFVHLALAQSKSDTRPEVIIRTSGGIIVDMYKLPDAGRATMDTPNTLNFVAADGQEVTLMLSDVKILKLRDASQLNDYVEYHDETDPLYYHERLNSTTNDPFKFEFDLDLYRPN